jgi:BatD DUF11 like domain
MNRCVPLLVTLLLAAPGALANLEAEVDTTTLSIGDSVQLTLRADGSDVTGSPDLAPLQRDFDVQSTQSSSQFRSINGRVEAWTSWQLLLKPKHSGTLTIPPLRLGHDRSRPIRITVHDLDPAVRRAVDRTVFFETSYEPARVYVQAQIIVTRKLFYASGSQLYGAMPDVPDVPGAMVRPLGDAEHSAAVRGGRQYGVIEQRFAVFPEHSGTLTIPAASVTGSVRLPSDTGLLGRRIGVDISSQVLTIDVLPIPDAYPKDAPWLPATRVELLEDWPAAPDHGMSVGTPSQRTLIARVEGNVASAIPPLPTKLPDSLKAYPESPSLNEVPTTSGIVGTRTESTSLVATRPGPITLPALTLTWWDTAAAEVRHATLDAQVIEATGAPLAPNPPPQQPEPAAAATDQPTNAAATAQSTPSVPALPAMSGSWILLLLGVIAAVAMSGWLVTLHRLRRVRATATRPVAPAQREAAAYAVLARHCRAGTAAAIRAALDAWLTSRYDDASLPEATARFTADADAHAAVNALNSQLYQQTPGATFDAGALLRCVDAHRRDNGAAHTADFPPLYPSV